jgi:hypothetical protein
MEYLKEQQVGTKKPKNPGKIKSLTSEAAVRNAKYSAVLEEIDQERDAVCEECGIHEFSHSHLIKRDFNGHAYMCVRENIRRNCNKHHVDWENGRLWNFKNHGPIYLEIVRNLDEQYYRQKVEQFKKRLIEYKAKNWLALSNGHLVLPKWVENYFDNNL